MAYKSFANTVFMKEGIEDEGCRLLLMGKTGSGKSTTGNLIFNETVFASKMGPSSVTRDCQTHTDVVNNKRVTVIDTPDFRFSTHTDTDSDLKLKRALELCSPGAHVILLILPLGIFTEQEMDFIGWFEQKFGVKALRHTLVIFTHADQRHMRSLEEMIRENTKLSDFINRGALRYHEFNIKAPANRQQVTELMEKIDKLLTENSNSYYTLEMMQETERRREEEVREREHQMTLDREGDETEEERRAECDAKMSKNSTGTDKYSHYLTVVGALGGAVVGALGGAVVGALGGAVVGALGGAVVGAFGGGVVGGVGGALGGGVGRAVCGVITKGGAHSRAGSTSSLMNVEEAQSPNS